MTAVPVPHPSMHLQPMTAAEYAELPEDSDHDYELQDGYVIVSAKPIPDHQSAVLELGVQLKAQVPEHLALLPEVDIDLELAPPANRARSAHPISSSSRATRFCACGTKAGSCVPASASSPLKCTRRRPAAPIK